MRLFPLILRQLRAHRGVLSVIAVLVGVTSFLAAAAPRALNDVYDGAAREAIEEAPHSTKDIQIVEEAADGIRPNFDLRATDSLEETETRWLDLMPDGLRAEIGVASHVVRTSEFGQSDQLTGELPIGVRHISMQYRSDFAEHVRYVTGGPPVGEPVEHPDLDLFQVPVAFSAPNAEALQLEVGDVIVVAAEDDPPFGPIGVIEVSGIYEAVNPDSAFWALDRSPITYRVVEDPTGSRPPDLYGVAIVGPDAYETWFNLVINSAHGVFRFPPDHTKITAPDMTAMREGLAEFAADRSLTRAMLDTNLGALLTDYEQRSRTATAVLSLGLAGLLAVALIVIALAAQLATERRRASLTLVRARGGSVVQLAGMAAAETLLVAAPSAALGLAAAVRLVRARSSAVSVQLVMLVLILAAALVTALVANQHRRAGRQDQRDDLVSIRPSPRRLVLEGLVVILAVTGVVLLHRRGLTTEAGSRGTDPFLVAVPVLLGFAAGLFALRAYPYPLRALARRTIRGRGAIGFLGIARASREALTSALPIVVLLLGLALSVFGVVIDRSLAEAQSRQAWQEVGADVRAARDNLEEDAIAAVRRVGGVTDVLPAFIDFRGELIAGQQRQGQVIIIAIDLEAYRRTLAGSPVSAPTGGDLAATSGEALPALVSPAIEARFRDRAPGVRWSGVEIHDVEIRGTLAGFPGLDTRTPLIVVPYESFAATRGAPLPNTLYISGSDIAAADVAAALADESSTPVVTGRAERLTEISDSPFVRGVRGAFLIGMAALGVFCMLAVLLMLVIGATPRGRTVSRLRTLGLTQRQARVMQLLEVAPLIGASMVAGVALGLALPRLVAPAVDLRPFAGGQEVADYPVDVPLVGLLVGGLAILVAVAVAVDAWLNRRRGLGAVLRVGE